MSPIWKTTSKDNKLAVILEPVQIELGAAMTGSVLFFTGLKSPLNLGRNSKNHT